MNRNNLPPTTFAEFANQVSKLGEKLRSIPLGVVSVQFVSQHPEIGSGLNKSSGRHFLRNCIDDRSEEISILHLLAA